MLMRDIELEYVIITGIKHPDIIILIHQTSPFKIFHYIYQYSSVCSANLVPPVQVPIEPDLLQAGPIRSRRRNQRRDHYHREVGKKAARVESDLHLI